jgi:cell division protein FtsB
VKSNKHYKNLVKAVSHYSDVIPAWVIVLATLAFCTTIAWRTYASWCEAEAQYLKIDTDVQSLHKTNAELEKDVLGLRNSSWAIEAAARARLNMVRPNEVVVPLDGSPLSNRRPHLGAKTLNVESQHLDDSLEQQKPATESKATTDNRILLSYIVLALYCGTALIGGFVVVKSFIALSRYIAGGGGFLRRNLLLSQTTYGANHKPALNTPLRLALLLFCGLVIVSSFTFSAEKYSGQISYRNESESLRRERARLLEMQQRLILQINAETSPAVLEKAALKLGMMPAKPSKIELNSRGMKPAAKLLEDDSKSATIESVPSNSINISPQTLKSILIILALLGGSLAIVFSLASGSSKLLTRARIRSTRINRAPGSNYLWIVDFFFSPRVVEETFKPIVADWRTEYFEALNQKRVWKARWVSVRYNYSFIASIGLSKIFSFVRSLTRVGR